MSQDILRPKSCLFFHYRKTGATTEASRRKDNSLIGGIAGVNAMHMRGAVSFTVSHVREKGKQIHVLDALVLPKVTRDLPVSPVDFITQ